LRCFQLRRLSSYGNILIILDLSLLRPMPPHIYELLHSKISMSHQTQKHQSVKLLLLLHQSPQPGDNTPPLPQPPPPHPPPPPPHPPPPLPPPPPPPPPPSPPPPPPP